MTVAELPKFPEHISYSSLKTWRQCQWLWFVKYALKIYDVEEFGIYLDFGKAIHRTIELVRPNEKKVPITYWERHFTKTFSFVFKKHSALYPEREQKLLFGNPDVDRVVTFDDFLNCGLRIIRDFLEHHTWRVSVPGKKDEKMRDFKVLNNELKLFEVIGRTDDTEIKFKGYVDLVILTKDGRGKPVIYVCDFKTCGWGWTAEQKKDPELQDQLFLYKYFLCKKFNLDQKQVRCAFVLMKRAPSKKEKSAIEFFPVSAGPVSVQRSVDEFNRDISEMVGRFKDGKLKKNREACINPWGDRCKYLDTEHCTNEDLTMKVIVAGPRDVDDYAQVVKAIEDSGFPIGEVVSGKAPGVDTLGEQYAKEKGIKVKDFPANWEKLGAAAGPIRNQQMAEYAEGLVAVVKDGGSPGTSDMISRARAEGLKVYVHHLVKG